YEYIPVISLNFSGLESNPGFKITLPMIPKMLYTVLYGDLLMMLRNQCLPYEKNKGETSSLIDKWTKILVQQMSSSSHSYKKVLKNYRLIIDDFAHIEREKVKKVKVGIVGEIFVKFSPLGNNNLEDFLVSEGAEIKVPGLLGFVCYCVYNSIIDYKLYGINKKTYLAYKMIYNLILSKEKDMIDIIKEEGTFSPPLPFDTIASLNEGFVGSGAKMGEGWLLTAEMIELIKEDVPNIVCTQPFGCLPNHIVGKGMMNPIKKKYPNVNIVAIDYDSGASKINQENRIKLMLANAKEKL
ncbi:MAG: 2-hydroxyglutaryl-CoA dehydratase, partial [Bacilli bacterium]|nr:2-hydroxyglutaryl-CoA dehydratase [Bacilli bacterium]